MGIQAFPVVSITSGGGGGGGYGTLTAPDAAIQSDLAKRWVKCYDVYDGQNYAIIASWTATSGASITFGQEYTGDVYMISPGVTGTAGSASAAGAGGKSGVQQTWTGVSFAPGTYTAVIDGTKTRLDGSGVSLICSSSVGQDAGVQYLLFGEPNHYYGESGALASPSTIVPAVGATGCSYGYSRASDTVYGSSATKISARAGADGIGAGGNGGARTDYCSIYLQSLINPGAGAVGMCMIRIPV